MSISVSLVAVFIPLLLMGGIVGRLFREFAITVTMTIAVSVLVSLTLSPMMCCAVPAARKHGEHHGKLYRSSSAASTACWRYRRGLDIVLRHQPATLACSCSPWRHTVALYIKIPKGFFPQQDTGIIFGLR